MINVLMNDEGRQKLISGVNCAAKVAQITYGPNGKNVICGKHITKDGMTAVSWLHDDDQYIMTGINLMKDVAMKTAEIAGDNTTTAMLLTNELVNKCSINNIPELKKGLFIVTEYLKTHKHDITSFQDLKNVAVLAANGDENIGNLVAEAFYKVGKEGLVTFAEAGGVWDHVEYSKGFKIDNGFSSPYFVNTPQGTCELNNVYVYISNTKIEEVKDIIDIANQCTKNKQSLLLMAPAFDTEIYVFLHSNKDLLPSCTVISPAFRAQRDILVTDIKMLLGKSCVCDKIIITEKNTTFIGYKSDELLLNRIDEIRDIINQNALSTTELNFHKKRLANFTSGIATIYMGGYSEAEIKEKLDRIEDSIRATDCAFKEGILPGGGITLAKASELLEDSNPLKEVLNLPMKLLGTNLEQKNEMIKNGIIEPYLVVKTALENAINMASMILTCDCVVLPINNF